VVSAALVVTTVAAFFIKGLTGFGPALLMVPIFSLFLPLTTVAPISAVLLLVSNLPLVWTGRGELQKRLFVPAALAFGAGVALGGNLLLVLPERLLLRVLGAALLGFCLYQLWGGRMVVVAPEVVGAEVGRLVGASVSSGLMVGATGAGALPLIIYLGLRYPKGRFRLLITYVFLVGSLTQVAVYGLRGLYTAQVFSLAGLLLLPMTLGLHLGARFFGAVDQTRFNRAVGALLLLPALRLVTS
jgi:uncharacterized membrane protein YfcA